MPVCSGHRDLSFHLIGQLLLQGPLHPYKLQVHRKFNYFAFYLSSKEAKGERDQKSILSELAHSTCRGWYFEKTTLTAGNFYLWGSKKSFFFYSDHGLIREIFLADKHVVNEHKLQMFHYLSDKFKVKSNFVAVTSLRIGQAKS